METSIKPKFLKKKKDNKLQPIFSRCLLNKKILLPIRFIGKNLDKVIEEYIQYNFEGKCLEQGYIKPNSSKILRYSSGLIDRGNNIVFEVVFECDICFPVEGMLISCIVTNILKAGVRAESANDVPSPIVVFIAKDHHLNNNSFTNIKQGDIINIRVIGQRFELNDKYISIIGEFVKEKEYHNNTSIKKPRLVIEE
jgi:DNA-directed RNA polymerase subunit E'/Rpb7